MASHFADGALVLIAWSGLSLKIGKGGQAHRVAAAADRTAHAVLNTHFGLSLKFDGLFFVDLVGWS